MGISHSRIKQSYFLDFEYNVRDRTWKPIDNYAFLPTENKRFLLKAEEICNPFKRHFIGVVIIVFKEPGHLDDLLLFLGNSLNGSPMLYSDGVNHMVQDLTAGMGSKPLFSLREENLIEKMNGLPYVKKSFLIPSGRDASDETISQKYEAVSKAVQHSLISKFFSCSPQKNDPETGRKIPTEPQLCRCFLEELKVCQPLF